jgi:hypothetical protein
MNFLRYEEKIVLYLLYHFVFCLSRDEDETRYE